MKLYKIIISVFGFMLFASAVNSMGVFSNPIPVMDVSKTEAVSGATITDLNNQTSGGGVSSILTDNIFVNGIWFLLQSIKMILDSISALAGLGNVLSQWGIPSPLVGAVMSMIMLIASWAVFKWLTGKMDKGVE